MIIVKIAFFKLVIGVITGGVMLCTAHAFNPISSVNFIVLGDSNSSSGKIATALRSIIIGEHYMFQVVRITNIDENASIDGFRDLKNISDPNHTIMITSSKFLAKHLMQGDIEVDDFNSIGRIGNDIFFLWVDGSKGISSFHEFVTAAKARGSNWQMGVGIEHSPSHLMSTHLNNYYGLNMTNVLNHDSASVQVDAIDEKKVSSIIAPLPAMLDLYRAGIMVPVLSFSRHRMSVFKNVPTLDDLGGDFYYKTFYSIVSSSKISKAAHEYYTDMFNKLYLSSRWQKFEKQTALEFSFSKGDSFKKYWITQAQKRSKLLKKLGFIR